MSHHAVVRENKSTLKWQIENEALSKMRGPSLNDALYKK